MSPEPARASDFDSILRMLEDAQLPHADVTPTHLAHFLVLRQGDSIAGVVGMEIRGDVGLLRSLAVAEDVRGVGLAAQLVNSLEARARILGTRTLYLLTTTADGFFARRGYATVDRTSVPEAILATEEFRSICPASAACMAKSLVGRDDRAASF